MKNRGTYVEPLNKRLRTVLLYFGWHGVLYVTALLLLFGAIMYIMMVQGHDIRLFIESTNATGVREFVSSTESQRVAIVLISATIVLISTVFHWIVSRALREELDIFHTVLSKSSTTNMLVNASVFQLPQLRRLAGAYNEFVRKKMQDYSDLTEKLILVEDLTREAAEEKMKNERFFTNLPIPVYAVYKSKHHLICYANKMFGDLLGETGDYAADGTPEIACLGAATEISIVKRHTSEVIRNKKGSITKEYRTYSGVRTFYEVRREPIVDEQGYVLMVITVLIAKDPKDVD